MTTAPKPRRRRKRGSKKNHYFTQDHEDAIIQYAKTTCSRERTELYIKWIRPAFDQMVDKIVFTYKFTNLPNCDSLRDECKIWLMTILDKYDPSKGSKAFSYFSVITKNWFIHKVKRQQKRNKREIDYDNISKSHEEEFLSTNESYVTIREENEFWKLFYEEIKSWDASTMKENDLKVYKAIVILFESKEDIEIFNKKAIYLYLREITGLNTKQIVNSLKKFRKKYEYFKTDWEAGTL
jgi:UDP-glucose 6-dehydrogenase